MKITLEQLRELIDERYILRGEKYYSDGMIAIVTLTKDKVEAELTESISDG